MALWSTRQRAPDPQSCRFSSSTFSWRLSACCRCRETVVVRKWVDGPVRTGRRAVGDEHTPLSCMIHIAVLGIGLPPHCLNWADICIFSPCPGVALIPQNMQSKKPFPVMRCISTEFSGTSQSNSKKLCKFFCFSIYGHLV
jgi:hypothetical protein